MERNFIKLKTQINNSKFNLCLIILCLYQIQLSAQSILGSTAKGYCDCYENPSGDNLRFEKFKIDWGEKPMPNGTWENGDWEFYWNSYVKTYYCGCNIDSSTPSILLKEEYWKNGKKHGIWKEYYNNSKIKSMHIYENDSLKSVQLFPN